MVPDSSVPALSSRSGAFPSQCCNALVPIIWLRSAYDRASYVRAWTAKKHTLTVALCRWGRLAARRGQMRESGLTSIDQKDCEINRYSLNSRIEKFRCVL